MKIGRSIQNSIFHIYDPLGIKFLTRLRFGLSHLKKHKLRHNFQGCLNPLYSYSLEVESILFYFFLHCQNYNDKDKTILGNVERIASNISY